MEGGSTNHTQVVIELTDANDNEPRFEMERVEAYVPEDQPPHVPFFAVQASDKDRGQVSLLFILFHCFVFPSKRLLCFIGGLIEEGI